MNKNQKKDNFNAIIIDFQYKNGYNNANFFQELTSKKLLWFLRIPSNELTSYKVKLSILDSWLKKDPPINEILDQLLFHSHLDHKQSSETLQTEESYDSNVVKVLVKKIMQQTPREVFFKMMEGKNVSPLLFALIEKSFYQILLYSKY